MNPGPDPKPSHFPGNRGPRILGHVIDHADHLSAIVLAGSAEDVLADLITAGGATPARREMAVAVARYASTHGAPGTAPEQIREMIRSPFNWLRHASDAAAAPTMAFDAEDEAADAIERAISNYRRLYNDLPAGCDRWDAARRGGALGAAGGR